jgi:hypothetical protein
MGLLLGEWQRLFEPGSARPRCRVCLWRVSKKTPCQVTANHVINAPLGKSAESVDVFPLEISKQPLLSTSARQGGKSF